jgi:hypothetical protein
MKKNSLIILTIPLLSFFTKVNRDILKGTWELNQIELNDDTIFYRGIFEYTLNHNFELNKSWVKNKVDSLKVTERAESGYQNSMRIKIEFQSDSKFSMTKVRSSGRISPDQLDYGTFELKTDTLFMTNHTRNDYKMMFIVDFKNDRIYQKDGLPSYMVYQEYLKSK